MNTQPDAYRNQHEEGLNEMRIAAGLRRLHEENQRLKAQQEPVAVARVDDLERGGRVRALAMGLSLDAPLYTRPPAREPLTDEQIDRAIAELGLNYFADAANNRSVLRELCRRAAHGIGEKK